MTITISSWVFPLVVSISAWWRTIWLCQNKFSHGDETIIHGFISLSISLAAWLIWALLR